jgi:hypothetical protein
VAELNDASVPKLAAGCRWGGTPEAPVMLFPEGMIKVEGTGRIILELCKIRGDVLTFLEQLQAKRIVDY